MDESLEAQKRADLRTFAFQQTLEWQTEYPKTVAQAKALGLEIQGVNANGDELKLIDFDEQGRPTTTS